MDKLTIFIERLKKNGVDIQLVSNYPWIYIYSINGIKVIDKFQAEHGFTVAFLPIKKGQDIHFTDITEIFKLIRKYISLYKSILEILNFLDPNIKLTPEFIKRTSKIILKWHINNG